MLNSQKPLFTFALGEKQEKTLVEFQLLSLGKDWLLIISGGDFHLGALACTDKVQGDNCFHYTLTDHEEGQVVTKAMEKLKNLVPGQLLVIAGIHYDDINKVQIKKILGNCEALTSQLQEKLLAYFKQDLEYQERDN